MVNLSIKENKAALALLKLICLSKELISNTKKLTKYLREKNENYSKRKIMTSGKCKIRLSKKKYTE